MLEQAASCKNLEMPDSLATTEFTIEPHGQADEPAQMADQRSFLHPSSSTGQSATKFAALTGADTSSALVLELFQRTQLVLDISVVQNFIPN